MSKLFRKEGADTHSSPDALDSMLHIVTPRGWAVLAIVGFCMVSVLAWSFLGVIPYTISGEGILFNRLGLFEVKANSSGKLDNLYFDINDKVEAGQIVARITHPELYEEVVGAQNSLDELQSKYDSVKKFGDGDLVRRREALQEQKREALFAISSSKARVQSLQERVESQKKLLKLGLITKNDLLDTQQELDNSRETIIKNTGTLKQVEVELAQAANDIDQQLRDLERQIETALSDFKVKQASYDEDTRIISPYEGIVVGIAAEEGTRVTADQTLLSLSVGNAGNSYLEVVLYFPANKAKRIKQGMIMQVAPGTVKQDKYGYALGMVTYVATYPATSGEMQQVLNNDEMVAGIEKVGSVLEVRAALIPDPTTPSGFAWTSSNGPPVAIQAGTTCIAQAVIERDPPITLVIPMLKRFFLGIGEED